MAMPTVKNKHTLNLSEVFKTYTDIKEQAHTNSLQNISAALKSLTKVVLFMLLFNHSFCKKVITNDV